MKRALIFGATGGIGQAIATDLAKEGWSLYLHYDKQKKFAEQMQEEFSHAYPQQDFFTLKVSFLDSSEVIKDKLNNIFPVNALIFAQGITDYSFLKDQDPEMIDKILKVNLTAPIKIVSYLEEMLLNYDHSRIIFLGSVYGKQASALEAVYSASKGGLSAFCKGYSREVASSHLTVNVLAPGAVDTPMNKIFSDDILEQVKSEIPAGRLANASDVSYWVKALLSNQADYLTGQTIYIDGGWLV
ncbi:elongation factor P 5-aminopentanone reductase [uncultured Lactobacillus sp.]|uniref:elongation factor P 5-aminopentanone reductase n=1 Tax=uncultured Lactobacillus sp. TaxID=153152 RepID=UPI002604C99D|nr:SDR family oxidoreductase [uncultured Lactobacillus sp.]